MSGGKFGNDKFEDSEAQKKWKECGPDLLNCEQGDTCMMIEGENFGLLFQCNNFIGDFQIQDGRKGKNGWLCTSLTDYSFKWTSGHRKTGYVEDHKMIPLPKLKELLILAGVFDK